MKQTRSLHRYGAPLLFLLLLLCATPPHGAASNQDEHRIKAAFVLNFAKLTLWPSTAPADRESFTIAVIGKVPSETFVNTLKSQTVHGARVNVRRAASADDARNARLLFIAASERHRLPALLKDLRDQEVLTVSDMSGFCEAGGMIGLVPVQRRIGFEVNLGSVRKSGLSLSSQLLKLARKVHDNRP